MVSDTSPLVVWLGWRGPPLPLAESAATSWERVRPAHFPSINTGRVVASKASSHVAPYWATPAKGFAPELAATEGRCTRRWAVMPATVLLTMSGYAYTYEAT